MTKYFVAKRKSVNPKEGKSKYGDVNFADETNKKYPLDTEAHVRAAASYFGMAKNRAKYSTADQKKIDAKIAAAEKKFKIGTKEEAEIMAKDMVIFTTGVHNGEEFTEADLDNMAATSQQSSEPIPIIVGHSSDYKGRTRIPAFGSITKGLKRVGSNLIAMGVEFNDKLASWIQDGFYPQRSIELTRDNKRVLALGMIGAVPPAVKGLPGNDEALRDIALQFSEVTDAKVFEFAEGDAPSSLDETEAMGIEDTVKSLSECCASFLDDVTKELEGDADSDSLNQKMWAFSADIAGALNLHNQFIKKIEQIEEAQEEYSEIFPGWKEFVERVKQLFNKRKESDVDTKKEQEYQAKIAELEKQNKEFADKAAKEVELKTKAEADAKVLVITTEVKTFCDAAVKENRMTPAMRETDEKIMLDLAKVSPDALKSFQAKYDKPIVPVGVVTAIDTATSNGDSRPEIIKRAEKYATDHKADKEFAGLTLEQATSRALHLNSTKEINLGTFTTNQGVK